LNDLVPFIDGKFRTLADPRHRAIAGLSMGAGQAMNIGLNNLNVFGSIGAFSGGGAGNLNVETSYGGVFKDPADANSRIHLLWIGSGTEDRAINGVRSAHQILTRHGIRHVAHEAPGGHVWGVWRGFLKELATKLFKPDAA
jgi:enterochelin esterase family protein